MACSPASNRADALGGEDGQGDADSEQGVCRLVSESMRGGEVDGERKWRFVRPSASPVTRGDWQAISYLARDPQPGGVLAGFAVGRYIPAETGRRTYIGDVFWSEPHPQQRELELERLLAGQTPPDQARTFVANTGARFLLADCTTRADLRQELAPIIRSTQRFGCATVYEIDPSISGR